MQVHEVREYAKNFKNMADMAEQGNQPLKDRDSLVSVEDSPKELKCRSAPQKLPPSYTVSKKVHHEEGDNMFRNILLFIVLAGLIIFFVDLHKQMHQERHEWQLKRKRCHDEYTQNQCDQPVDVMKDECHQLEICFRTESEMSIRMSQIVAKLVGKSVDIFLKETGKVGAALVMVFMALLLYFIYRLSRTSDSQETVLKKHE